MAVRTPSQPSDKNRRQRSTAAPQTVREIAEEVSSAQPAPATDPVHEAEMYAKAAGVLWRSLDENRVPPKFHDAMFCNWMGAYFGQTSEEVVVCETPIDFEEA